MQYIKQVLVLLLVSVFINACAYKPSSKYARATLGEKISTSVVVSQVDPENTVLIKDAVDSAIVEIMNASLTTRAYSDSHLVISMAKPGYIPIQYDSNGYIVAYRMKVTLNIIRYHNGESKKYSVKGSYDFSVTPNAVVTDQERFDAIRFSASKAINSFIALLSAEGTKK